MTEREALNLALEALQDYVDEYGPWSDDSGAQYVLRVGKEALAQHVAADDTSQERVDRKSTRLNSSH